MTLEVLSGPLAGQRVELDGELTVGRDPANGLALDDGKVSRRHAALRVENGRLTVVDSGSSNGTWVNGERIAGPRTVDEGDRIRIGRTELRVRLPAAPPDRDSNSLRRASAARRSRSQGTTTLLRLMESRMRRTTILAGGAVVFAAVLAALAIAGVFSSAPSKPPTVADVVAKAKPSTVKIVNRDDSSGTGWVFDAGRGLIATNFHVVDGNPSSTVMGLGRNMTGQVVGLAPCEDLAVLRVAGARGLVTLPLGRQAGLHEGETVAAVGYPGRLATGDHLVANAGVISDTRTSVPAAEGFPAYPNLVQTDAPINHGNSGGPLLDLGGRLVGVNTLGGGIVDAETGIVPQNENYAIGVDRVRDVVPGLAAGRSLGFMGAFLAFPSAADMKRAGGAFIQIESVVPGSWAAGQGLGRNHEWIVAIGDRPLKRGDASEAGWCEKVGRMTRGQTVKMTMLVGPARAVERRTFDVRF